MNIIYQQLYQAKFGQYMAYSGQVARGVIELMSDDVDGVRGSGPDGNKTEDETKIEVLVKGEDGDIQSESHSKRGRQMGMLCYLKMIFLEPKWKCNSLSCVPTMVIFSFCYYFLKFIKSLPKGRTDCSNLFRHT